MFELPIGAQIYHLNVTILELAREAVVIVVGGLQSHIAERVVSSGRKQPTGVWFIQTGLHRLPEAALYIWQYVDENRILDFQINHPVSSHYKKQLKNESNLMTEFDSLF
jgi:hypothetical protein